MTNKQNFEKDINVPSKEQIIIDGVDVSECKCLHNVEVILEIAKPEDFEILCGATNGAIKCEKWKDCYFKQLARKTQECEEIKEKYEALKLENQEGYEIVAELKHECKEQEDKIKKLRKNLALEIELNTRYRKALEEIEEICKNGAYDEFKMPLDECSLILDIINKAKGEKE